MDIVTRAAERNGFSPESVERGLRLHRDSIVIDASAVVYRREQRRTIQWDRYAEGGITATNHTVSDPDLGYVDTLAQIGDARRWIDANADKVMLATSAADIERAHADGIGAILFGPQDAGFLDFDLGRLHIVHDLGVRILQLTYQRRNCIGDGCQEANPGKLSDFGRAVVREMDALRMVIDVSHTSEATSFDVIENAERPVVLTHAHPAKLTPHIRAKSDELLTQIAATGGVVGLTTLSTFVQLNDSGRRPTVDDYLAHIDYLVDLIGPDHVGIGSDLDESLSEEEVAALPNQEFVATWFGPYDWESHLVAYLTEAVELPIIAVGLAARGYDDTTVRKILGGNFLRVFREVWGK